MTHTSANDFARMILHGIDADWTRAHDFKEKNLVKDNKKIEKVVIQVHSREFSELEVVSEGDSDSRLVLW